jgi:galactonate dehydratase
VKITGVEPILCDRYYTFCKITTDENIVGWGDGTEYFTPKSVASNITDFGRLIIGEDPRNIEKIWQLCWRSAWTGGKDLSAALCAIESALWDIKGKLYGVPAIELMGGRIWDKVRLYTHGRGNTLEEVAKDAEQLKNEGWTAYKTSPVGLPNIYWGRDSTKLKGSIEWPYISRHASLSSIKDTEAKVKTIRETLGTEMEICMDAGNSLDIPSAIRLAKALEPYKMFFLEDLICQHEDAAPSYKRITESTSTPIATGENLYTIWQFRSYLQIGALSFLLPDISHVGITQGKKIAALAEAYHLPICPHNPNSPLSNIQSANLVSSTPNFIALEFRHEYAFPEKDSWVEKIMNPPLSSMVKEGYLTLPDRPGWGVEMNEEEIAKHPYVEPCYVLNRLVEKQRTPSGWR